MKDVFVIGYGANLHNTVLHDLTGQQKIKRDIENNLDSYEFKKRVNSRPRKNKSTKR